jgi:hypothetical protein
LGFPARDYPGKSLETIWPGFDLGAMSPCLVLWRGTCPSWLSLMNSGLGSTQILTWHHGAMSQTVSQPLLVIETPEDGVGAHAAPHSDNPDGTMGLH